MGVKLPKFVVVKISAKRFVVAELSNTPETVERPVIRYYAVTTPLPYKDAADTLLAVLKHGGSAVPRASRPTSRSRKKEVDHKVTSLKGLATEPAPVEPRPVLVQSGYAAEWD
jgi:hypothetical protein